NNNDSGVGSLRQAILDANANGNEATDVDTINIQVSGEIVLTSENVAEINLLPNLLAVYLRGNQITLKRGPNALGRFCQVGANSSVEGITFDGGNSKLTGGGVFMSENASVMNCLFINNSAGNAENVGLGSGGALRTSSSGSTNVLVENCTFTNNRAQRGAAIWNGFGATVTISNCTFSGNSVDPPTFTTNPAVVYNDGTASLDSNIIFNNPVPPAVDYYDVGNTTVLNVDNLIGSLAGPGSNMGALVGGVASMDDPMLGPLQNNGGATQTFATTAASPQLIKDIEVAAPPEQVAIPPLQPETVELIEQLEQEAADLPAMNSWKMLLLMGLLLGLSSFLLFSNRGNI
ncbi:MAG: choice-of-anchor Q domain-containing protein, partial [Bacteroidota bacterium]